jgi:hypothetical protein
MKLLDLLRFTRRLTSVFYQGLLPLPSDLWDKITFRRHFHSEAFGMATVLRQGGTHP